MRDRRLAGIVVLLLVIVGVVVANRFASNSLAGNPIVDWPKPPPVGSCLDLQDTGPRTVPCEGEHDAEVTKTFDALNPMTTAGSQQSVAIKCGSAAAAMVNRSSAESDASVLSGHSGWHLPGISVSVQLVHAPSDQRAGRYGWSVCVIQPQPPVRYTGTVGGSTANRRPAAFGTCYDSRRDPVSCAMPHAIQVLASLEGQNATAQPANTPNPATSPTTTVVLPPFTPVPESGIAAFLAQRLAEVSANAARQLAAQLSALNKQCREVAATRLDTDDPNYGGDLAVGVYPGTSMTASVGHVVVADPGPADADPQPAPMSAERRQCVIKAADGRLLTDSMIGWGDQPPPLIAGG